MLALDRFPVVGLHSEYIPLATGAQGTGAGGWATLRHGSGHSYKDIHLMNSGYFNSLSRHKTDLLVQESMQELSVYIWGLFMIPMLATM